MKRVVLALLAVLLLAPSLAWGDDSRHYEFRLAANGEATYHAAAGDTVTVSLSLCRTTGTGPMFAMQDEICFDPAFFAYQPDGTLLREGVKTTLVTLRDGRQAVYMNYVDFGGGADWGWANLPALNSTTALAVTLSYTLQLYFDFSGYTDMARGIGKMLGVTLPENFDVPYQALTIRGFWKGWHMTMTRFFTRYLYIPLGGSRRGLPRTCVNTLVIFLASGLWHGADWSFVVWGGLHGIAMVADRLLGSRLDRLHPALSWALTFGYVNFCWIFFRAGSVREALAMCRAIARCAFGPLAEEFTTSFQMPEITWIGRYLEIDMARLALLMFLLFVVGSMFFCLQETPVARRKHRMTGRRGVLAGILLFWAVISLTGVSRFIYSNF